MTRMAEDNRAHQLKLPKLKSIKGGDRVNAAHTRFEQHMTTFAVPKPEWHAHLRSILEGNALTAFLALSAEEAIDYDTVKLAILQRMGIDKDTHLKHWWEGTIKPTETATQWLADC